MESKKEKAERRKGYWKVWRTPAQDKEGDDELGEEGEEKDRIGEERRGSGEMQLMKEPPETSSQVSQNSRCRLRSMQQPETSRSVHQGLLTRGCTIGWVEN